MRRKSTIVRNWPKYLLQWGVLAALVAFLTGIVPSPTPADPEAYCPMGGLQALATFLANKSLPCSMSMLQICMGIALIAAVVLFSKLFCGYICPLGTVQDILCKVRNALHIKSIKVHNGSFADKVLRIVKYALVFWIFYMTMSTSELFCKNIDPYYAIATGFKGEITLWMSIISICVVLIGSFTIDMFWCRYICPLGAISNSMKFWVWTGVAAGLFYVADVLGLDIPWVVFLGVFCILGYLLEVLHSRPGLQILHVVKDPVSCNGCGLCSRKCPYHIDIREFDQKVCHVDCTLCGECIATCPNGSLNIGVCRPAGKKILNLLPALLTVGLIWLGIWAGGKMELPTIDMKWDIEQIDEDGTKTSLVDIKSLETTRIEGLHSVKCFGSAMAFKAKLQKTNGVHGVKVFVKRHYADILYNPAATSPEDIQRSIYVPSRFKVNELPEGLDTLKTVTIRTEKMYDKMDINYLGLLWRKSKKKIYHIETEFACPLIVRVYMDPAETVDEDWFREVVETDQITLTYQDGTTKTVDLDYKFVKIEE